MIRDRIGKNARIPSAHAFWRGVAVWIVFIWVCIFSTGFVLAQAAPPEEDIRPARAQLEAPAVKLQENGWVYAAVLLLVIALAVAWIFRIMRKKPQLPAEVALASLMAMRRDQGTDDAFASKASEILRRYISAQFRIPAISQTTEEFLHQLSQSTLLKGREKELKEFLQMCDATKYAAQPLDDENRIAMLQSARGFVIASSLSPTSNT